MRGSGVEVLWGVFVSRTVTQELWPHPLTGGWFLFRKHFAGPSAPRPASRPLHLRGETWGAEAPGAVTEGGDAAAGICYSISEAKLSPPLFPSIQVVLP